MAPAFEGSNPSSPTMKDQLELNIENKLTLKWGMLKSWKFCSEKAKNLVKEYGIDADIPRQKEIICKLIDLCDGNTIYLHWDGKYVSKDEAKNYVMNYNHK